MKDKEYGQLNLIIMNDFMKKKVFYMILALCPVFVFGQKVAYLHTDSVLLSISQYRVKMIKLDSCST